MCDSGGVPIEAIVMHTIKYLFLFLLFYDFIVDTFSPQRSEAIERRWNENKNMIGII